MNMKLKVAAAAVLAGLAGSASAAVLNTGTTLGVPGDVVLVAVDNTAGTNFEKTFVASLGITYAQLVNHTLTSASWNFLTDANYSTAFSGFQGHDLTYYITGGYALDNNNLSNFDPTGVIAPFTDSTVYGGVISAQNGAALTNTFTAVGNYSGSGVVQAVQNVVSDNINAVGQNGISAAVAPTAGQGSLYSQTVNFGQSISLTLANHLNTGAGVNGSLYFLTTNDPTDTTGTTTSLGTLSFNSSTGVLSFGGTTPVPIPAAVWLFGSAIAGMLGFARRRSA